MKDTTKSRRHGKSYFRSVALVAVAAVMTLSGCAQGQEPTEELGAVAVPSEGASLRQADEGHRSDPGDGGSGKGDEKGERSANKPGANKAEGRKRPSEPQGQPGTHRPVAEDFDSCIWYSNEVGGKVCVANPLPNDAEGREACSILRDQGFGPLGVGDTGDPIRLDRNKDGVGCSAGDYNKAPVPPDGSAVTVVAPA